MGVFDWIRRLLWGPGDANVARTTPGSPGIPGSPGRAGPAHGIDELARRLDTSVDQLRQLAPRYHTFNVPKRAGGVRRIAAPDEPTRRLQRLILRRLLARLRAHDACHGFERGRSIATNAAPHAGQPLVVRIDLKRFFESTSARRVQDYFRAIGWDRDAARLLTRLCTHQAALPQGAPTSPRLSNLVNHRLDARLAGLARRFGARYTRYADDITFSLGEPYGGAAHRLMGLAVDIIRAEGYEPHLRRKFHVARAHQQQRVTGLVVNHHVDLPRRRRRWLRAVEHRLATGRPATLTPRQLAGWRALELMVHTQAAAARQGGRT